MTQDEQTVLLIRGAIASMPESGQAEVMKCYMRIKEIEAENEAAAIMAIALRGAELAAG